jgi:signal peptidase I
MDEKKKKKKSIVREYTEAFLIAIVLALLIRMFVIEAFKIPSGSMIPTLLVGDHLLVSKFVYKFTEPKRGDIVVFKYPDGPSRNFIKRIVAVGGDTVEIKDKAVFVNGIRQEESYVQHLFQDVLQARFSTRDNFGPIDVPQNHYFMLGDNRDSSLDSRFWDNRFVNRRTIVGKALIIYWSWKRDDLPAESPDDTFVTKLLQAGEAFVYYVTHFPGVVRWNRIAHVIH